MYLSLTIAETIMETFYAKMFANQASLINANVLRKEVIQPQVPLRLPCYDFIPVTDPTVARCLRS